MSELYSQHSVSSYASPSLLLIVIELYMNDISIDNDDNKWLSLRVLAISYLNKTLCVMK